MTKVEKDRILLELYSLYNNSSRGELYLDDIRKNITSNNDKEIENRLVFLRNEGLIKFELGSQLVEQDEPPVIWILPSSGITFTEKGFDYLKELKKKKLVKIWELLYKFILPIGYLIDFLQKYIPKFFSIFSHISLKK